MVQLFQWVARLLILLLVRIPVILVANTLTTSCWLIISPGLVSFALEEHGQMFVSFLQTVYYHYANHLKYHLVGCSRCA